MHAKRPAVLLQAQSDYDPVPLADTVDRLLQLLVVAGSMRGAKVLLKPNLITARNGALACTDARLLAAIAQWFIDQGAQVAVGDSPAFGSATAVLGAIGALPALQRLGVEVVEFGRGRPLPLPCGRRATLATAALECDLLVNIPKVKAHAQMRVTLATKNLFGCLVGWHKPWWHMVYGGPQGPFAELLVQLLPLLPAGCTLVDGIQAMHRTGPIHGVPYGLGLLAGGANPVAVDTALLAVLKVPAASSPLWRAAHEAQLVGTQLEELQFPLMAAPALAVDDFEVPSILESVRFNPLRFSLGVCKRALSRRMG